jgi:hypothetical protein
MAIEDSLNSLASEFEDIDEHSYQTLRKAASEITQLRAQLAEAQEVNRKQGEAFQLPNGYPILIAVNQSFNDLFDAIERAESKGYLPDAIQEEWDAFSYRPIALTKDKP